MSFARAFSGQPALPKGHIISVEADVGKGLHAFAVVGLPDKAVEEARDRISSAIKNSGEYKPPKSTSKKIVLSLAPASIKKEGSVFDVPMALSYLLASGDLKADVEGKLFAGELGLDGNIRPVTGILSIAIAARENGFTEVYVPQENRDEAALVSGIQVFGVKTLRELIDHLEQNGERVLEPHARTPRAPSQNNNAPLEAIRGQEHAKRALEIAAAGKHNIALFGPPGTGKTMLARALTALLPPLSEEEMIEVTTIHSYAGVLHEDAITEAPFRAPHHSASNVSLVGGGTIPRPGEITLAHRGVLFMDEFPEFARDVINALRQPLEDRIVSVTRARGSHTFPANFMLIAALNPCPCGYFGSSRCSCPAGALERYQRKLSGPIADRIDMWVSVSNIAPEDLHVRTEESSGETKSAQVRVEDAHGVQRERYKDEGDISTNADLDAKRIEALALLHTDAENALVDAAKKLHLSPRSYHRTIKLARTIADLAGSEHIEVPHMLEALQYRKKE